MGPSLHNGSANKPGFLPSKMQLASRTMFGQGEIICMYTAVCEILKYGFQHWEDSHMTQIYVL